MKVPWSLEELLPHRPPMVLVDAVEDFDPSVPSAMAGFTVTDRSAFVTAGGVPGWVAIEYMAQTAAILAGCLEKVRHPDAPPKPGLLLGTRRLSLAVPYFALHGTYRVVARMEFAEEAMAAFECTIADADGKTVASAMLNAYRPDDFIGFVKRIGEGE